ncbi:MAG TPA: hypothetical protein VK250_10380 [Nitrososphaeraceae archaeon]|nr:hypothetical protein [Nitrososphaeraceae archaeon]
MSLFNIKYEAFSHSFTSDDSITFLALAKQAAIALELAKKNFPQNVTIAMEQSDKAASLVGDVYYVDDNIVDDNDFIKRYEKEMSSKNSTIHSLLAADLIDQILREYASAIVLDVDLTNMSNLAVLDNFKKAINSGMQINYSSPSYKQYQKLISANNTILNYDDYQTSLALTTEVKNIFNYLKSIDQNSNKSKSDSSLLDKLEMDIDTLHNILLNNGSAGELMRLVHLTIHPVLQEAFNLKTKMNMNMNMGMNMMDGQNMNMMDGQNMNMNMTQR